MAFKLPFFNDDSDTVEDLKAKGNALLNTAFGLGPLGYASYKSVQSMKSNNPNFLARLPTNQMGDVHSKVGESFDRYQMVRSQVRKAAKENSIKKFKNVDEFLSKLAMKEAEEQTAFLANLRTILADPNIADSTGDMMDRVENLMKESFQGKLDLDNNRESLKAIIGEIVDSETSASNRVSKISGYASSPFHPVSDLLVQPQKMNLSGIQPNFNQLDSSSNLINRYKKTKVFQMLESAFSGSGVSFQFKTRTEKVGSTTGIIPYVELHRGGRKLQTLPLDLGNFSSQGVFPIRYGNMNTMYAGSGAYVKAGELNTIAQVQDVAARRQMIVDKMASGAFMTPEEALADMFITNVSNRGGIGRVSSRDLSLINQNIQQSLEFIDRFGASSGTPGSQATTQFLEKKYRQTGHSLKIINPMRLGPGEQKELRPMLSQVMDLMGFSANPFTSGNFNQSMGDIGLRGAFLHAMYGHNVFQDGVMETAKRQFGGILTNRATQPITARFRQMYNREEFLRKSSTTPGASRAIAIMDVLSGTRKGEQDVFNLGRNIFGIGEGTANYLGETVVTKAINKPVYDPSQFGGASNIMFEELKHRVSLDEQKRNIKVGVKRNASGEFVTDFFGSVVKNGVNQSNADMVKGLIDSRGLQGRVRVEANQLIYKDIGDFFRLFGAKEDNFGLYLGMIDGRRQYLPRYTGLEGMEFGLTEEVSSDGRGLRKYSITGFRDTDNPFMKIFSTMFKGTIEKTDQQTMKSTLTQRAAISSDLADKIINRVGTGQKKVSGAFTSDAAMLKKASMNLAEQIAGSLDIFGVAEKGVFDTELQALVTNTSRGGMTLEAFEKLSVSQQSNTLVKNAVKLALEKYGTRIYRPDVIEQQGLTFGYFAKSLFGGSVEGISGDEFEQLVRETHREMGVHTDSDSYKDYFGKLKKQISKGIAVGLTNIEIGPQSSSLGQNMGSMEPRLYNFLSYKLTHEMGLEKNKVSDFMFSVLSRKKGTNEDIIMAREYSKTMQSFAKRSLFEEDMTRVSVGEFIENTSEQDMRNFLSKQKGGFLLDFSGDRTLTNRMASSGFPSQIYLPGGDEFLELLERERTLIPTDDSFREIDADYIKSLNRFSRSLVEVSTAQSNAESIENALRGISDFKESMSEFFGMSFRSTLRGKMAGSTFGLGGTVDTGRFEDDYLGLKINRQTGQIDNIGDVFEITKKGKYRLKKDVAIQKKVDIFSDFAASIDKDSYGKYVKAIRDSKNLKKSSEARNAALRKGQNILSNFLVTEDQMKNYLNKSLGSVNYSNEEKYLMRKIQRVTFGHAVFQDSTSFLNAMSSFTGGVNAQHVMENAIREGVDPKQAIKKARIDSRRATREALQYFFLSPYEQSSPSLANFAVATRHPVMGPSHVEFAGTFRELSEIKGRDEVFERLMKTEGGQRAAQDFEDLTGRKVKGFKSLLTFIKEGTKGGKMPSDQHILKYMKGRALSKLESMEESLLKMQDPVDILETQKAIDETKAKTLRIDQAIATGDYSEFDEGMQKVKTRVTDKKERSKLVRSFFDAMRNHMGEISPGVGGGRITIPQFMVDVHYGGKVERMDLSLAGGMIGDFDGDIYQLLYPTRSNLTDKGIGLIGKGGKENLQKLAKEKLLYRAKTRVLFSMAGEGVDNIRKSMGDVDRQLIEEIAVKARQEQLGKNVGPIDVSFDALRLGIVNTADESTRKVASDALNMLSAVQEVAVLKAKKLPTDMPLAEAISRNLNLAIEGRTGAWEQVEKLFRDYIFKDVDLGTTFGKANVVGGGADVLADTLEGQRVINLFAPGGTSSADDALTYVMPYLKSLLGHVGESGYLHAKTERRLSIASRQELGAYHEMFQGLLRNNVQGRLMGSNIEQTTMGDLEEAVRSITSLMRTNAIEIGSKGRIGSLGVGLAATMALGSSLGYGGYDPTPLSMEGEIVSPELKAAIREGNAFEAGPSQEAVQDMQNSIESDIMNRQINIGQVLADSPGGFQMRGRAQNMRSVSELSYIVGSMGGQSHFTINDTRSPVSENYIRRKFFGD